MTPGVRWTGVQLIACLSILAIAFELSNPFEGWWVPNAAVVLIVLSTAVCILRQRRDEERDE